MHVLPRSDHARLLTRLATIPFNTNFAEAVLRGHVTGSVLVDEPAEPRAFLVAHPCGMSLLAGEACGAGFNAALLDYLENRSGSRTRPELLQVYPDHWVTWLRSGIAVQPESETTRGDPAGAEGPKAPASDRVIEHVRLNYRIRNDRDRARRSRPLPEGYRIARLGAAAFEGWPGATMPPRCFWGTASDFDRHGTAWAVMHGDTIASLAFSAFVFDDRLEIGIETHAAHQGLGLATHACTAFIDDCLARGLEPVWSCRQGNLGSERTAGAVGFEETHRIPYFALAHRKIG